MHAQAETLQLTAVEPKAAVTTPGSKVTVYGTGFSPDAIVYIGGLQVRETTFIGPSKLEVVTPYLRPGVYQIQIKSEGVVVRSDVSFKSLPAPVDSDIDHALGLVGKGQSVAAIAELLEIAKAHSDYQVRSLVCYEVGQIYFAQGDWWRWGADCGVIGSVFDAKAGMAVQTSWRYRLSYAQNSYLLPVHDSPVFDLKIADWLIEYDVTQHTEPRFHRSLVNARYGNLEKASADCEFILKREPRNPAYRALAAYIGVLRGDPTPMQALAGESTTDIRALSLLGQAAFLSGDSAAAQRWWIRASRENPHGAALALLAGKKHLARDHSRIAAALLNECVALAPGSKEAEEARELLAKLDAPSP